jgi:hypothetical protein
MVADGLVGNAEQRELALVATIRIFPGARVAAIQVERDAIGELPIEVEPGVAGIGLLSYFSSWKSVAWPTLCVMSIAVPLASVMTLVRLDGVNQWPYERASVVSENREKSVSAVIFRASLA